MLRGRGREMSAALDVLRSTVRSGQGRVLEIVGEPGIGKTTLLRATAEQARRMGYVVGVGKAEKIGRIAAGAPLLVALRSGPRPLLDAAAFAELGALYSDRPIWLVDRIASMLEERALTSLVLVAVDDVQWADELTRFALDLLPGRLTGSPVVWVTAARLDPGDRSEDAAVPEPAEVNLGGPIEHRIILGPLRAEALEELATDRLGARPSVKTALLLRTVGGSPFWAVRLVEAVAREGDSRLPADLLLGVRARLPDDDPDLIELLRTCAVWGRSLEAADAAEVLELPLTGVLAAAEQGVAEGLLERTGTVVSFRHDLIGEALYADLTAADLARRHRECGRYLRRTGASPLEAAPHFTVGATIGDHEAIRVLREAAAEAAEAMPGVAAELARQAFDLVEPGTPEHLEVGEECAALLIRVRHGAAGVEVIDRLLTQRLPPDDRARLEVLACLALWSMDRLVDIGLRVERALAIAELSTNARTGLAAARTLSLIQTGSAREAAASADAALDAARSAGDATAERMALLTLTAIARQEGRHELAFRRTRALRELVGDDHLADEIRCLQLLDRYDEAARLLAAGAERGPAGVDVRTPDLIHAQMWQEINLGRLEDAEAEALTLLRLADELGQHGGTVDAQSVLAFIALVRGEPDEARHRLRPHSGAETYLHDTARKLMGGWIALLDGDAASAAALYNPLVITAETSREYWPWFPLWARPIAAAGLAARHRPLIAGAVRLADAGAERNPGVASFAGLALQTRGLADGDTETLGNAVDVLRRGPRPLLLASALADHGQALLTAGVAPDTALDRLTEARRIYDSAGATHPAAAIDRALADSGLRPARPTRRASRPVSGWGALTDTERQVAELIGAGNTNREAAAALGTSPNTVGTHLRSVFAKLEVRSRVQLANVLHERNQTSIPRRLAPGTTPSTTAKR